MSYESDLNQALTTGVVALVENCLDSDAATPGRIAQALLFDLLEDEAVIREIYYECMNKDIEVDYMVICTVLDSLRTVLNGGPDEGSS